MVQAQKLLPLPEAFRAVLRNYYPQRPALADEIKSRHWFMYLTDKPTEEVTAAESASNAIYSAIRDQRLRLKGCLGRDEPADIDPIEIARGNLDVFDGTLKVRDGAATLWTYIHLHCYEEDILLLKGSKSKRGRRSTIEKEVVFLALQTECRTRGLPQEDNDDPKWRCKADAERWVTGLLEDRRESLGESRVREIVKELLERISRAGN